MLLRGAFWLDINAWISVCHTYGAPRCYASPKIPITVLSLLPTVFVALIHLSISGIGSDKLENFFGLWLLIFRVSLGALSGSLYIVLSLLLPILHDTSAWHAIMKGASFGFTVLTVWLTTIFYEPVVNSTEMGIRGFCCSLGNCQLFCTESLF